MPITSYRDLELWRESIALTVVCYEITNRFPACETFGLRSQMNRSAVSVPSNIAEGHSRQTTRDFVRFLFIARGSLAELETQIEISKQLRYLDAGQEQRLLERTRRVGRMLNGLLRTLQQKIADS